MEEFNGAGGGGREGRKKEEGRGIIVILPMSSFIKGKVVISSVTC